MKKPKKALAFTLIFLLIIGILSFYLANAAIMKDSGMFTYDGGSIVPDQFFQNWEPGIPGGIPEVANIFATIDASVYGRADEYIGTGAKPPDARGAIQAAIDAAGAVASADSRQAVYLPKGVYYVSDWLYMRSNVAVRGDGIRNTVLIGSGNVGIVMGEAWFAWNMNVNGYGDTYNDPSATPVRNVTGGARMGDASLSVADAGVFKAGDILKLDAIDGAGQNAAQYITNNNGGQVMATDPYGADRYGLLNDPNRWIYRFDWDFDMRGPYDYWGGVYASNGPDSPDGLRPLAQYVEIDYIDGNTLHLKNKINHDFPADKNPQVWNTRGGENRYMGLEDLTLRGMGDRMIYISKACSYSWVKDVECDGEYGYTDWNGNFIGWQGRHIVMNGFRNTIRDSYIHDSQNNWPGGNGYGICVQGTDCLIENNIATRLTKPIVGITTGGGNVIAYNYVADTIGGGGLGNLAYWWQETGIDTSHCSYSHSDLYEGNYTPNITTDSTHGNNGNLVLFRNYCTGRNESALTTGPFRGVEVQGWNREQASIGNVLISPENAKLAAPYLLGGGVWRWDPDQGKITDMGAHLRDNGQAERMFYKDLDYNYVDKTVFYDQNNPVKTLPDSLYLKQKPGFFGALNWPPVNPFGQSDQARVQTLPAKLRYESEFAPAPEPPPVPGSNSVLYDGKAGKGWQLSHENQGTVIGVSTDSTYADSLKAQIRQWGYVKFVSDKTLDINAYSALSFWIKGDTNIGNNTIHLQFSDDGLNWTSQYQYFIDVTDEWSKVTVPVADITGLGETLASGSLNGLKGVMFASAYNATIYLDKVTFEGGGAPSGEITGYKPDNTPEDETGGTPDEKTGNTSEGAETVIWQGKWYTGWRRSYGGYEI